MELIGQMPRNDNKRGFRGQTVSIAEIGEKYVVKRSYSGHFVQ